MNQTYPQTQSEMCTACVLRHVQPKRRHWLLDLTWGRELLKTKLRQVRPELLVPQWREIPALEPLLDDIIDQLGLREWSRPVGFAARLRYLKKVFFAAALIDAGHGGYDFQLEEEGPTSKGLRVPQATSRGRM
jgi:hypothetical protein